MMDFSFYDKHVNYASSPIYTLGKRSMNTLLHAYDRRIKAIPLRDVSNMHVDRVQGGVHRALT